MRQRTAWRRVIKHGCRGKRKDLDRDGSVQSSVQDSQSTQVLLTKYEFNCGIVLDYILKTWDQQLIGTKTCDRHFTELLKTSSGRSKQKYLRLRLRFSITLDDPEQ